MQIMQNSDQSVSRENDQIIRPADACKIANFGMSSLYRHSKRPDFPKKVRLSKRCVGWWRSDFIQWLESRGDK